MPVDTKAVVNRFLDLGDRDGIGISPMKLQKLLYYAHGWHLALTNEPLLGDRVEAWRYGPVVAEVYHMFKGFGNSPIRGVRAKRPVYAENRLGFETPEIPQEANEARKVVDRVWDVYKTLSAAQLSNMTHGEGTPWSGAKAAGSRIIEDEDIKAYFYSKKAKAS